MTMKRVAATAAVALALAAGAAQAATYGFNFAAASSGPTGSLFYTSADGELSLTVTGRDDRGASRYVETWRGFGLGVLTHGDNSHALDSRGPDDIGVLAFNKAVTITSVSFGYITGGSAFDLLVGPSAAALVRQLTGAAAPTVSLAGVAASTHFGVEAADRTVRECRTAWSGHGKRRTKTEVCEDKLALSQFKITGITVDYTPPPPPPPAPVPVPAAGLLLGAALAGLGLARRRR